MILLTLASFALQTAPVAGSAEEAAYCSWVLYHAEQNSVGTVRDGYRAHIDSWSARLSERTADAADAAAAANSAVTTALSLAEDLVGGSEEGIQAQRQWCLDNA